MKTKRARYLLGSPADRRVAGLCLTIAATAPIGAVAQTANPGPGLVGLSYANDVEQAAAVANQTVFNALDASCNPGGIYDKVPVPTAPPPGSSCNDDRFIVYLNTRELVHTANEIRGSGATIASLGQNLEGLGLALRWTAAEELAAQGSMATEFANGQLANLAARMNALRFGAAGFGIANRYKVNPDSDVLLASTQEVPDGGGASGATTGETYSRWGGFLNGSFGYGSKEPTPLEDAFDFDGSEVTLGVDYRFPGNLVLGGVFGFSEQAIEFDEAASKISVVDGNIDSDGKSLLLFAMYEGERLHFSGLFGAQSLDYDVVRNIKYPSFNPDLESTNSLANSHPETEVRTAAFNIGYAIGQRSFTFEPFFNIEYMDATVHAFAEERSINLLSDTSVSTRLDLAIGEQSIDSLDATLGIGFHHVLTPRFGMIVPYLSLEAHRELEDDARTIGAGYAAIEDILGRNAFTVPTDVPDESYSVAILGFTVVLRGGRQRRADSPIAGGLSAFLQFKFVENLTHYDDSVATGGFRYEF